MVTIQNGNLLLVDKTVHQTGLGSTIQRALSYYM